jgi:hypothetical protein
MRRDARLGGGEVAEQLARGGVGGGGGGAAVEGLRLALHALDLLADPLDAEVLDQPDRARA